MYVSNIHVCICILWVEWPIRSDIQHFSDYQKQCDQDAQLWLWRSIQWSNKYMQWEKLQNLKKSKYKVTENGNTNVKVQVGLP